MVSLDSPTAKVGSTRCRSPISSGFRVHSVAPRRSPVDSLLPCGRPLMTMTLLGGTASVPSSAIGKLTCSPADAWSALGAERTGGGSADWTGRWPASAAGAVGSDQGMSMARSQKAASVRFGSNAATTRTAVSLLIPEARAKNGAVNGACTAACGSPPDGTTGGRGAKRCAMRDAATPSVCGERLSA